MGVLLMMSCLDLQHSVKFDFRFTGNVSSTYIHDFPLVHSYQDITVYWQMTSDMQRLHHKLIPSLFIGLSGIECLDINSCRF